MFHCSWFLALLTVTVKYGSLNPAPLDDLTINLNLGKPLEAKETIGQKIFEEEHDLKAGESVKAHAVVIGGVDDKEISHKNVQIYKNGGWEYLEKDMRAPLNSLGAASLHGDLFIAGGREESSEKDSVNLPKNEVLKRPLGESSWYFDSTLRAPRTFPTLNEVQTADGKRTLMLTGGQSVKNLAMQETEIYQGDSGWKSYEPMLVERYGHAAAVVGGKLHVLGGHANDKPDTWFNTEIFNFTDTEWYVGDQMNKSREFHAAAVLGGQLYTCGGYRMPIGSETERVFHKSCEQLYEGKFVAAQEMNVARAGFGMVRIDLELWAIGGFNKADEALDSVERLAYNKKSGRVEWIQDLPNLKSPRKFFGATRIDVLVLESAKKIVNSTFVV